MTAIKERQRFFDHLSLAKGRRIYFAKKLVSPFALLLCLLISSLSLAESNSASSKGNQANQDLSKIPEEYGEVIYQSYGESSKQLYIIGVEHRDAITRSNGINTSKVQAEVYKIGEWLIQNEGLRLLLPEGFFTKKTGKAVLSRSAAEERTDEPKSLDFGDLEKRLADNRTYVNAEMLLKQNYGLRTRQIEEKILYDVVHDAICKLPIKGTPSCDFLPLKSRLDYLQEKRVAAMLQKIPGVVDEEFQHSNIKSKRALFTIGISHLPQIIKYLNNNKIEIHKPLPASGEDGDYAADLNLLKEQFGITVIVPKKLADDDAVLKLCGLDKIVEQCRKQTPSPSPKKSP
jgi:hypothetical protein